MSKNKEADGKVLDHNYDGIQELDNALPKWWLYTFYACIVFAGVYWYYYEIGSGLSSSKRLEVLMSDVTANQNKFAKQEAAQNKDNPIDLNSFVGNAEAIVSGNTIFTAKCAACHGQQGEGGIGPNLMDNFWLHGDGKIASVVNTITVGVPEKGMLAWGALMKAEEIAQTAAYIVSLKGSDPAKAKAPEGVEVK